MAILEPMEKVYVLRVRIQMYKDSFRIKNTTMREGLSRATELAIDALGYKSVVMNKEQETILIWHYGAECHNVCHYYNKTLYLL